MKLTEKDVVLFSGDSITDGNRGHKMDCNHILGHGYQYIVAGELALKYCDKRPKFINKGYSGFTMSQLLDLWQEDVIGNKPTVISILAGVNDGLFGFGKGITSDDVAEQYRLSLESAIIKSFNELKDVTVIVCEPFYFPLDKSDLGYSLTPHPDCEPEFIRPDTYETAQSIEFRVDAIHKTRAAAKETAEKLNCAFVPLYEPLLKSISASEREYFTWDGTHPTVTGHYLIAKEWLKKFEEI